MSLKKFVVVFISALGLIYYSNAQESIILQAAQKELNRNIEDLKSQKTPPYYISYQITDTKYIRLTAELGKIKSENNSQDRTLDIDLRVGSNEFDNTHVIRGNPFSFSNSKNSADLPLENNELAIRTAIWSATDKCYKASCERYEKALTNKAVKVQEEDTSADLSYEKPYKYIENIPEVPIDIEFWKNRIRKISDLFNGQDSIYESSVSFSAELDAKYFVSSEGSLNQRFEPYIRVFILARTKANDGMNLPLYKSYFAYSADQFPTEDEMLNDAKFIIETLNKMRNAEIMKTFTGPAILSGEASGVFFHEIFGHRAEGHRQKDPNSTQTFKNFLGKKILPDFIDVIFDPTIRIYNGKPVSGSYKVDDQGVQAQKVNSVEKGIFESFLMCRSPIDNFPISNGHGRKQAGYSAVSRQSNLIVVAHQTVPFDTLRAMLKREIIKQGKDFGLLFAKVESGYTFTSTSIPNAFNVNPVLVYKVYPDDRPDDIVRGVDLIGTPLATFTNIIAASDDISTFNGICGAESGGVPVSASSPSLLVSLIEVQKKAKSQAKPPILPAPAIIPSN